MANLTGMNWVGATEEYIGNYGWGPRGRNIGVSRMMNQSDKNVIAVNKFVATIRPRGVLSGFFVILPNTTFATYLPPVASKKPPFRIRLSIPNHYWDDGLILSAYVTFDNRIVLEDVLVWKGESQWNSKPFSARWTSLCTFAGELQPDKYMPQIELAKYDSLANIGEKELDIYSVLELVPEAPNQKRLIRPPPPKETPASASSTDVSDSVLLAKKELGMGPDVFSVWRGDEKLGLALVKTLTISRALRAVNSLTIPIQATWNKQFDKWEVTGVVTN